jgi:hypothetical protein
MLRRGIATAFGAGVIVLAASLPLARSGRGQDEGAAKRGEAPPAGEQAAPGKVYGEWTIRVKPDKGAEYGKLIQEKGLPLFREAGGRMVGWWNTLIGDLYEQVTIWEYDGMPAFEKAIGFLGKNDSFHQFVRLRDPLLGGEECRFLRLSAWAEKPALPETGRFLVHEIHRVPLSRMKSYLEFMERSLPALKKAGFRFAGPWETAVGNWNEVTYLFRYESLEERDRLIAAFRSSQQFHDYELSLNSLAETVTTRLLVPAPFAK